MAKILIVDDEQAIREILAMMIEETGTHQIVEADCGRAAIETIKQHQDISIVFCDYRMENGNGGDVYRFIHSEGNMVPYVMISTDRPEDHAELLGFRDHHPSNDYLAKPFELDHLEAIIKKLG